MRVRLTRRAVRELDAIFAYVSRDDPRTAASLVEQVAAFADLLADFPHIGRASGREGGRFTPIPRFPYLMLFRVRGAELQVLSVRHAKRRRPA